MNDGTWSYAREWLEIRQGSNFVFTGVFTGKLKVTRVEEVDEEQVWLTFSKQDKWQEVYAGQDLVLQAEGEASGMFRLTNQAPYTFTISTGTRKAVRPVQDVVREAFNAEELQGIQKRRANGDVRASDILYALHEVNPGIYLLPKLHSLICKWPEEQSVKLFFAGDVPLYPGPCPDAQDAVNALEACENLAERRTVFQNLPKASQEILRSKFGRSSKPNNAAKSLRKALSMELAAVEAITHGDQWAGPFRLITYHGRRAKWPPHIQEAVAKMGPLLGAVSAYEVKVIH